MKCFSVSEKKHGALNKRGNQYTMWIPISLPTVKKLDPSISPFLFYSVRNSEHTGFTLILHIKSNFNMGGEMTDLLVRSEDGGKWIIISFTALT
jgi:hypothetical protein